MTGYVREVLDFLKASRMGYGDVVWDNDKLVDKFIKKKMPIVFSPPSLPKPKAAENIKDGLLKKMLQKGVTVSISSDNPAYSGGYINENYMTVAKVLSLGKADVYRLAKNSFLTSFLPGPEKANMIARLDEYMWGGGGLGLGVL